MALDDIDTIVFVMLENRSFDHMLGYLSLDETMARLPVDGLRSDTQWLWPYGNKSRGAEYPIRKISATQQIRQDPPHGRRSIEEQINSAPRGPGRDKMGGFVESYVKAHRKLDDPGVVMGYYDASDVPTYDFLARNFCVCDKWFTSVPLGTQANRLMAMAGESRVLDNVSGLSGLPDQKLVYDWLKERSIPWRVYVSGGYAPFFMLMPRWRLDIALSLARSSGAFRRFSKFAADWQGVGEMPPIVFIEPAYADAPMSDPNDDHPPVPISKGQEFVRQIYKIVTSNEVRWRKTLMVVTYDEHGGFFDHVPPPELETVIEGVSLKTLGPRVPALLVSPFVGAGQVFSEPLDHTSMLQLIAERFGDGTYSDAVNARQASLGRIAHALRPARDGRAPAMPPRPILRGPMIKTVSAPTAPNTPNAAAMDEVFRELARNHPEIVSEPGWSEVRAYLATNDPPEPMHSDNLGDVDEL
jgi:phospholipase C